MTTPHKHEALIKAWAEGATIECFSINQQKWVTQFSPYWFTNHFYRIKPEPKSDVIIYGTIQEEEDTCFSHKLLHSCKVKDKFDNIKLTFDGETGKLKAAEVL